VFGTNNFLHILRPFSDKRAPINGLEWSFVKLEMKREREDEEAQILMINDED
jgi:hypothetical protein